MGQGLSVSPYCLGLVGHEDTVQEAFRMGINFFFLPTDLHFPLYHRSREGLRKLLNARPSLRNDIVVAAVSYMEDPRAFGSSIPELLISIPGLERIDVAVAGASYHTTFHARLPVLRAFREDREQPVSATGASFHCRQTALVAILQELVDVAYIRYNAAHPGARTDLLPYVRKRRRTLVFNFLNSAGYVSDEKWNELELGSRGYQRPERHDHYRFVLSQPGIDGILCAAATPAELARIDRAITAGPMSRDEAGYLETLALLADGRARLRTSVETGRPGTHKPQGRPTRG